MRFECHFPFFNNSHLCLSIEAQKSMVQGAKVGTSENIIMSYDRILSIENLSDVPNPWKGFTMNRCLVLALVVLLVSSGVSELHDAMDSFVEETGIRSFLRSLQDGSILQISIWDNFMGWWESEELGAMRRRKKPIGNKAILKPKPKV
ncbi:hypothetical protein PFLUV_G00111910 [Perca fluviatilis]|uniref:Uncharacterized protein n=1 Tax=Perca fluviatilis TaxID=8168 RepID=A0A6A5F2X2_PERFL|nr:hypothetical protein PFLUV_G00111910 [Perca fluviatilis]